MTLFSNNKRFLFSALALGCLTGTLSAFGEGDRPGVVAVELKNFPNQNVPEAVYQFVEKKYIFDASGTCEFRCKSELRVNTLHAMNDLCGETFLVYNPRFQSIKINAAYTIMADGTRVETPKNAFNIVLPKYAADAPAFNFLKELVITHTALEPGATIFLDYSIVYANTDQLPSDEYPDMPFPCERLVLNFNGTTTEYFDVPARSREAFFVAKRSVPVICPGMSNVPPHDFSDMSKVVLGERGKKQVATLVTDAMSRDEKIAAIEDFVNTQIATVKIPLELLQESDLRSPDVVLNSAYGVPLEKARLLWAMLKEIGMESTLGYSDVADAFFLNLKTHRKVIPIDLSKPEPCFVRYQADIELSRDRERVRGGISAIGFGLDRDAEKCAKSLLGVAEKDFEAHKTFNEERINFSYSKALLSEDGILVWRVPVSPKGIAVLGLDKLPQERNSELVLSGMIPGFYERYTYNIELGEAWELLEKARDSKIENAVGVVCFDIKRDGNNVYLQKSLKLKTMSIAPKDYPAFRELLRAWFAPENNRLLFRFKS